MARNFLKFFFFASMQIFYNVINNKKKVFKLRSETMFKRHLVSCCRCGQRFMIGQTTYATDLFNTNTKNLIKPISIYCKSYFCETCSKYKKSQYRKRIANSLSNKSWRFLTLTTVNTGDNTRVNLLQINKDWNRLKAMLNRKGLIFNYVKSLEVGAKGMVHLHIMVDTYLPIHLIRKYWHKYCGAYKCAISRVADHNKCVNYCLKYLSKLSENFEINKMFYVDAKRRLTFSRSFQLPQKDKSNFLLISDQIYKPVQMINYLKFLLTEYNFQIDDFDFNNLPPPFKENINVELKSFLTNHLN